MDEGGGGGDREQVCLSDTECGLTYLTPVTNELTTARQYLNMSSCYLAHVWPLCKDGVAGWAG